MASIGWKGCRIMYFLPRGYGSLEIICGPMFSGKSEELIRRVKRAKIAKQKVIVFKPEMDDRYSVDQIASHDGNKENAVNIQNAEEMLQYVHENIDVIGIDEVQFIKGNILQVIKGFMKDGKRVICAGLDMDFKAEPFGNVPSLLAIADSITKLTAVCVICGNPANRTQRLINGNPAKINDPLILIGADEQYQARCRQHHMISDK